MAGVTLRNVTKRFKNVVAVNNVSFEIKDKEFLVLVGPSGCGKTTALRMIAGLEEITEGEILIGDRVVNDVSPKDRDIAMVFQNYALYPHMSVYDNMAFGLKLRMLPGLMGRITRPAEARAISDQIRKRVETVSDMLGLRQLLDRKPKQLSGGQRQRVALGRAIVREPKVFLMDEPLSNLDAKLRVQTRAELIKLHRQLGITTIYVTHDQVEAMTMGERIAVMKDGVVQQIDTPLNLFNYPANLFVAGFIGSPAMNFIPAMLEGDAGGVYVNAGSFRVRVPDSKAKAGNGVSAYIGKEVTFGIRPQHIYDKQLTLVPATPENTVRCTVDVSEPMGSVVTLYLTSGPHSLVAEVDAETKAVDGAPLDLVFDMEKTHLFDRQTEIAIY
ncbi:MAG: sn-glycerol-3-phosphate ABC transporter ATP-binding protein UgpC [Armatimonadetes bacterium]|jgi:multiple sugar transport system ATP-binding protein|nr:sn-glycerol-3-phosphate ABC transporter ATP-binding protein UgpC [Armatimonadota bacterium]